MAEHHSQDLTSHDPSAARGPIAWMADNAVAANLVMIFMLVGGLILVFQIKQEVFPEFTIDMVTVAVPYPGASPEEVERGIILAIEEEVRGVDGVKRVRSVATEGMALVVVELMSGTDRNRGLQDIKSAVDRITSFPQDAERPVVSLVSNRREVVSLILYGDLEERTLRQLAETARDELLQLPNITYVELEGIRPPEIGIEVPQENLRAYNLTLDDIANEVARTAIELPAGGVKTKAGEILLRTDERRDYGLEFIDIPVVSKPDGSQVRLSQIATIIDGFRDIDRSAYFYGKRAIRLVVYRIGDQTPLEVSAEVKNYMAELRRRLPASVGISIWEDRSEIYGDRVRLLLRNGALGLTLVLIILGLFLEPRLAFWVTMGIPISFLGSFLLIPLFDVSINMISLFAFIVSLGIVVDDAIVVGENIYECRQRGLSYLRAAVEGAQSIKIPVSFAILTNMAAFIPLFFVPGTIGKFFRVIPAVVVSIFAISWLESLFVLPSHLAHQHPRKRPHGLLGWIILKHRSVADGLDWFIRRAYAPVLRASLRNRYLTASTGLALMTVTVGYILGGRIDFSFLPKIDADVVSATASLPYGAPVEETKEIADRLYKEAWKILSEHGGESTCRGIFTLVGSTPPGFGPQVVTEESGGSHLTSVQVFLVPSDRRDITASQFAQQWRDSVQDLVGLETLDFTYSVGPSAQAPINIELSHPDINTLEAAASDLAAELARFAGVKDIDDGFTEGKPQLSFKVRLEARSLGITAAELARQVRAAFYGARAFRQQRGRDEIWVMVRLPENERRSEYNVEDLLVRTPLGGEIPLLDAAEVIRGRAYTEIRRADGRRVVNVTADVVEGQASAGKVLAQVKSEILPALMARYPGLRYGFEGEQREQREAMGSLAVGFALAQLAIFTMLAIPFRSYIQPVVVMSAIPFGLIGAVLGHLIMGYQLSVISMMGIVALSGVVVNDSLVLVYHANQVLRENVSAYQAVVQAGTRRFRPILLTSLTTFGGLAPMIFETSVQARFLIPMAISLGYGVLFSTLIVLVLVPSFYLIVEDLRQFFAARPALNA